ncbi:adenosylcobinamide-GDP ribazoletransferase [Fusibacter ferrireducens]|uniref:Adenosylcobinamide-GDP ribazoletransferase n=1 Tax=Fusibacter ferrireducens TaxID=2785058 RepID=A0ABR9ZWF4_9FIRM|nr:adenosylcobinamide-GDP ribazoletransferase [Fusibacter ferrireducens]MBF4694781.1 adenosylcobinamide-GDP ribazoletransferase [Fusibacter ferrireducens]
MKAFLLMLSFFSRIPVGHRVAYSDDLYRQSIVYFPYVGLIVGGISAVPLWLLQNTSHGVRGILVILVYLLVSGGIHLDGLADSMDGLFSGREKERILEIMKDSRIGSFGVIGLILYFLVFYQCASEVMPILILLMPFVGKSAAAFTAGYSDYARVSPGMGTVLINSHTPKTSIEILVINLIIAFIALGFEGLAMVAMTFILAFFLMKWIHGKIGGMTGDTIGFVVEVCQMCFLLIATILY